MGTNTVKIQITFCNALQYLLGVKKMDKLTKQQVQEWVKWTFDILEWQAPIGTIIIGSKQYKQWEEAKQFVLDRLEQKLTH
jgi:hypothetical protein